MKKQIKKGDPIGCIQHALDHPVFTTWLFSHRLLFLVVRFIHVYHEDFVLFSTYITRSYSLIND